MLRAGRALPHHDVDSDSDENETTYDLHDRKRKRFRRKNLAWSGDEFIYRRSLITRIITKPCRSIKALLVIIATLILAGWYLTSTVLPGNTTFVFHEVDTRRVWEWEIQSGHWMSWRPINRWFHPPRNPSLPSPSEADDVEHPGGVIGCGWKRRYVHVDDLLYKHTSNLTENSTSPQAALFPPRPVPGSIVDFDIVNQYCDHTTGQFLRTCLSFLTLGARLDVPHASNLRIAAPKDSLPDTLPAPYYYLGSKASKMPKNPLSLPNDWRYCYMEDRMSMRAPMSEWTRDGGGRGIEPPLQLLTPHAPSGGVPAYTIGGGTIMVPQEDGGLDEKGKKKKKNPWDVDEDFKWAPGQCDEEYPRIIHMSWEGTFGDAPYMTLLSFLYTQNLGFGHGSGHNATTTSVPCRPQFWIWIREADETWEQRLATQSWSKPFLDKKYEGLITFKQWDTTAQMDAIPELAPDWRNTMNLDLGWKAAKNSSVLTRASLDNAPKKRTFRGRNAGDDLHATLGLSVGDTARWLLPHRYGGIYVEPGMLFLRDWEELWNYRGSFSIKSFNGREGGSLLRLNKDSALGTIVLRTALRHGMRLDAQAVRTYVEDAGVDQLLFPLPDVLQNLAFWSNDVYQKQRPTVPTLDDPEEFFVSNVANVPASTIGIPAFFRGAWFYYARSKNGFPFDIARNYAGSDGRSTTGVYGPSDQWDVPWSAVFKRTYEAFMRGEQPNMYGEHLE